jgi:hypothetical protein
MDKTTLKTKVVEIESKRNFLVELLEKANLGNLRIDVNQALEELDELMDEFHQVFPEEKK